MTTQSRVLRGGWVLRTGATRPECLDIVIGPDGCIVLVTPSAPALPGTQDITLSALPVPTLPPWSPYPGAARRRLAPTRSPTASPPGAIPPWCSPSRLRWNASVCLRSQDDAPLHTLTTSWSPRVGHCCGPCPPGCAWDKYSL